eukprot:CAMPEP_0169208478 /NCGR_PEP_ID=MMETSP1016-20121227/14151_1 /TAXON_ID=342587 /ORGANISM="Karlodinium micrum, Strain CCMP2283" /LENGTH=41 /DNA_ID= /DNA_START= /DNA_END= /DNA_ORIENTATION=
MLQDLGVRSDPAPDKARGDASSLCESQQLPGEVPVLVAAAP